jgi:C4-dicarboxylate-specific signal transduction histidine kinase
MGIINYVQYARDKSNPDIAALLTKADRELHRISDIVANLLRFARPPTAQFGPVSLQEPARQAADLLAADLRGRGIQLQDNLPDKLPLVQAEASTLQQIFLNLIINARDAVMIRTERRITLSGGAEDDQIWVDIADTGPGIAPDLLGRIFDPFFSTKPPGQGTGLGLSVSSSIAAGFGGSLSVQATGADGSRFRVSLPRPGHAIDPEQP